MNNLLPGGILIFDVRTFTGWQVNFFRQKVTTFATPSFQRIWINQPDFGNKLIRFDIFIRTRQQDGSWGEWRREQMQERMWHIDEVQDIVNTLQVCQLKGIFNDNFSPIKPGEEPGLAYVVLQKILR